MVVKVVCSDSVLSNSGRCYAMTAVVEGVGWWWSVCGIGSGKRCLVAVRTPMNLLIDLNFL